ncbi:MAG: hypothetical protein WCJ29_03470, partial [bacterium]
GGGGGGIPAPAVTGVSFEGKAYPFGLVYVLRDGVIAAQTSTDVNGSFKVSVSGLTAGTFPFLLYGQLDPFRSNLITFTENISTFQVSSVKNILVPPTLALNNQEIGKGDPIKLFGQSTPQALVTIDVFNLLGQKIISDIGAMADGDGKFIVEIPESLAYGDYSIKAFATLDSVISGYGTAEGFKVGTVSVPVTPKTSACDLRADLNLDCRVNLVDYSIAAFWWHRTLTPDAITRVDNKLYQDGVINLRDFSIMAYFWTG